MTTYTTDDMAGVAFGVTTTDPLVKVGTVVRVTSSDNVYALAKFAMYVKANGVIGNSNYATVALTSISCLASSVDAGTSGTALYRNGSVAFADGEYGWLYIIKPSVFGV